MIGKLLTEYHLEFLSLKGDCRGSSESTHVTMPHCWKSHVTAHLLSTDVVISTSRVKNIKIPITSFVNLLNAFRVADLSNGRSCVLPKIFGK